MSSRNSVRIPSYRLHKPTELAVVRLSGRDHYLGKHGTRESKREYQRLIAEWLANGHQQPPECREDGSPQDLTINELFLPYWGFAEQCEGRSKRAA